MLKSVTKKYEDLSTMKQFAFVFFCDCCGKSIPTPKLEFISGFRQKPFLTNDERQARAIIYAADHDKAYERANNEVLHELNRCESCGEMICDDCSVYDTELDGKVYCRKCREKKVNIS